MRTESILGMMMDHATVEITGSRFNWHVRILVGPMEVAHRRCLTWRGAESFAERSTRKWFTSNASPSARYSLGPNGMRYVPPVPHSDPPIPPEPIVY